jgi:hypothetical protein
MGSLVSIDRFSPHGNFPNFNVQLDFSEIMIWKTILPTALYSYGCDKLKNTVFGNLTSVGGHAPNHLLGVHFF